MSLAKRIQVVKENIEQACQRSGRSADDVKLLMVSKTVPASRIFEALETGLVLLGENKAQELRDKASELKHTPARWHFIGHLQSNKIKDVIPWVEMIQSVDRLSLAKKLNQKLIENQQSMPILIQVNTSYEDSKSGVRPEHSLELMQQVSELPALQIKGLMTIGLWHGNENQTRDCFKRLKEVQAKAHDLNLERIHLSELSMGMSGDYQWAIEEGATLIRVGGAIFGERIAI